jgi:hypothetical protein
MGFGEHRNFNLPVTPLIYVDSSCELCVGKYIQNMVVKHLQNVENLAIAIAYGQHSWFLYIILVYNFSSQL